MRLTAFYVSLALVLLAAPAGASLESGDLFAPDDGLVTVDSQGREWLDLTLTTDPSFDVASNVYVDSLGFSWATADQVTDLLLNEAGFAQLGGTWDTANAERTQQLLDLMGCTAGCDSGRFPSGSGFVDTASSNDVYQYLGQLDASPPDGEVYRGFARFTSVEDPTHGYYLVRDGSASPVPEPNAAMLFVVGLATVGTALRRSA